MKWYSALAIYFLFWSFSVFLVLPFGVRTAEEAGQERGAGHAESAPVEFRAGRIAIRVTIVATIAFAIFMLNFNYGWVTPRSLDLLGVGNDQAWNAAEAVG